MWHVFIAIDIALIICNPYSSTLYTCVTISASINSHTRPMMLTFTLLFLMNSCMAASLCPILMWTDSSSSLVAPINHHNTIVFVYECIYHVQTCAKCSNWQGNSESFANHLVSRQCRNCVGSSRNCTVFEKGLITAMTNIFLDLGSLSILLVVQRSSNQIYHYHFSWVYYNCDCFPICLMFYLIYSHLFCKLDKTLNLWFLLFFHW